MKKFTLLFLLFCTGVVSYAQVLPTAAYAPVKQVFSDNQPPATNLVKGSGDVIWQTTFDWKDDLNPQGWSLPTGWTITDVSDMGNPWIWANDTIRWSTSSKLAPPSYFQTKADGFLAMPIQAYNDRDGVGTDVPADAWVQTPKINCSAASSVVVKFTQAWNLCCLNERSGNLEMLVTTDAGVHFATYDLQFNIAANNATPERFRNVEINISDVAAGSPNVQIRFYFHGGSMYYYWMLDDLKLTEGYDNDLVLEDYWLDFDGGFGETVGQINYWPLSQMGMAGNPTGTVGANYFKGALLNRGNSDSENAKLDIKILKNGAEILSDASPVNTIWTLERDTATVAAPFIANDFGDYRFDYKAVSDNNEEIPINNSAVMRFTVNDTLAHRADFTAETGANTGGWVGGDNAGDMTGVAYDIYADCEINSITAYIYSFTASRNPSFQYVLMKDIDGVYEEWMVSEIVDMDSTLRGQWVTLPLTKDGETEFLTAGGYATMVRMWATDPGDPTNGANGMWVGYDMTTKPFNTLMYQSVGGYWYSTDNLNMVGFNVNATGAPTQAPVTFNVDMTKHIANGEFKPATDKVDVSGFAATWTGVADMTDTDGDGIYTATVDAMPVGKILEYKYRVNGTAEAYPTTGYIYRKYTVRYWNVVNSTYNGGVTTGVPAESLTASFSVYPNPTPGAFTIDIANRVASDLVITLTNIQGQVIYQNQVANTLTHRETIDNKLSKGLYFLSVKNGAEVKVQKIIVQ